MPPDDDLNFPTKIPGLVRCSVVVIEDMERDPAGTWLFFATPPRVGEWVNGYGRVEQVNHYPFDPTVRGSFSPAEISIYVTKLPKA